MVSKASLGNQPLQAFAMASLSHWPELGPVTNGGGKTMGGKEEGEGREDMQIHTYSLSPSPTYSNLKIVMRPDP